MRIRVRVKFLKETDRQQKNKERRRLLLNDKWNSSGRWSLLLSDIAFRISTHRVGRGVQRASA